MIKEKTDSIYQFAVKDSKDNPVDLAGYQGKVLLIVNTASKCGFTPQLQAMEELYEEFREEGLEILAFPSNDFAGQEPLEGEAIEQFCMVNYQATYPIFEKMHVVGPEASPLYRFLSDRNLNGKVASVPRWNFHKYLIDREGKVRDYFYSFTSPTAGRVKRAIRRLLAE